MIYFAAQLIKLFEKIQMDGRSLHFSALYWRMRSKVCQDLAIGFYGPSTIAQLPSVSSPFDALKFNTTLLLVLAAPVPLAPHAK